MASYTYEHIELGDEHALGCKCCRFSKGVDLPVPKKLSHEDAARLARTFSFSIFKDWTKLNAILKRFEGLIHKRWLKKSPKQRRDILLKAWPDMPTTHRPDFAGFRRTQKNTPRSHTLPSSAYLWPYINLEDLQQRHLLPLFIKSRGRNLPHLFVPSDVYSAHLGDGWNPDQGRDILRMELHGQSTPSTYGQLRTVQEISSPTSQRIVVTISRGLLALEIQQQIYSFLLSCVLLILHDIEPKQHFLAPTLPAPTMPTAETNDWPSLSAHALEVAYMAPQAIDVKRLAILTGARRASAEDHLWMLTEDPGYFMDSLKEWKEHSQNTMQHSCSRCWRHVAERMIGDAFTLFIFWHWIHRQLMRMAPFETQLRRANHDRLCLDPRDEKMWLELLAVVQAMEEFPIALLSTGLKASPRLRHTYYTRESIIRGDPKLKVIPEKHTDAEKRIDLLFHAITSDRNREIHTLNHLIQEAQYMLEKDPEASLLMDSWLTSIFADLAMLSELSTRIERLEPWATGWCNRNVIASKATMKPMEDILALDSKIRDGLARAFSNGQAIDASKLLDVMCGSGFEYPAKRRTEQTVSQMQSVERLLDVMWEEVECCVVETSKINIMKVIKNRVFEPRTRTRTAEWIPPLIAAPPKDPVLAERSANAPRFGEGTSTIDVVDRAKDKAKIKTRGVAGVAKDEETTSLPTEQACLTTSTTSIKVPKRAYKVLSALFPPQGAAGHQRTEIAWEELLQAMNAIGFQPMKLYGSVWIFMPKANGECKTDTKRSIQFHEPKEVRRGSKIPAAMVRTFGRRMKHAFGWVDGMFICE